MSDPDVSADLGAASSPVEPFPTTAPRVACVQDGARLHYALPLALQRAGLLDRVYTEWYAAPGSPESAAANVVRRFRPALGRRMADRYCPGLDHTRIVRNPW